MHIMHHLKFLLPAIGHSNQVRCLQTFTTLRGHRWYPDAEYVQQFSGPTIFRTPETDQYYKIIYNSIIHPVEKTVKNMWINFGPQHPAAHGVLRLILELDGENVLRADPHVGFLHRATEKLMEYKHYNQSLPYMDRLDYVSTFSNEQGYCLAIEKLLNVQVPPRAKAIRILVGEIARIANHFLNIAGVVLDAGGITPFFWLCEEREKMYEMFERLSGARVHNAYLRPGGVSQDLPIGFLDDVYELFSKMGTRIDETEDIVTGNRLFYARTAGIGYYTAYEAISMGFTGPMLRCTGVKWDLRISFPYDDFDFYDFDVPIGTYGDSFDRHILRVEECRQSIRIINQVIDTIPDGEIRTDDSKITLPKREEMKTSMESLIHHFKMCTSGFSVPPGSTYTAIEHPKGEFGMFLVADGTSKPYRAHVRACSLPHLFGFADLCPGLMLADIAVLIATIDVVFGDVDR